MRVLTRDQQAKARQDRGCPEQCCCLPCCTDDYVAEVTEKGYDPYEVDSDMLRSRLLMEAKARPRPASSGNGSGGKPSRKRKVPPPSVKQLDLITKLFSEREFESPLVAQVLALETYGDDFGGKAASTLIDLLMKLPRVGTRERAARHQLAEVQLEEGRLYAHPDPDAEPVGFGIYRVQRSKQSGKLYALLVLEGGGTRYAPGVVTKLDPNSILSLDAAQAWGRKTGTCCNCYAKLTNPESVERGLGPVCAGKFS